MAAVSESLPLDSERLLLEMQLSGCVSESSLISDHGNYNLSFANLSQSLLKAQPSVSAAVRSSSPSEASQFSEVNYQANEQQVRRPSSYTPTAMSPKSLSSKAQEGLYVRNSQNSTDDDLREENSDTELSVGKNLSAFEARERQFPTSQDSERLLSTPVATQLTTANLDLLTFPRTAWPNADHPPRRPKQCSSPTKVVTRQPKSKAQSHTSSSSSSMCPQDFPGLLTSPCNRNGPRRTSRFSNGNVSPKISVSSLKQDIYNIPEVIERKVKDAISQSSRRPRANSNESVDLVDDVLSEDCETMDVKALDDEMDNERRAPANLPPRVFCLQQHVHIAPQEGNYSSAHLDAAKPSSLLATKGTKTSTPPGSKQNLSKHVIKPNPSESRRNERQSSAPTRSPRNLPSTLGGIFTPINHVKEQWKQQVNAVREGPSAQPPTSNITSNSQTVNVTSSPPTTADQTAKITKAAREPPRPRIVLNYQPSQLSIASPISDIAHIFEAAADVRLSPSDMHFASESYVEKRGFDKEWVGRHVESMPIDIPLSEISFEDDQDMERPRMESEGAINDEDQHGTHITHDNEKTEELIDGRVESSEAPGADRVTAAQSASAGMSDRPYSTHNPTDLIHHLQLHNTHPSNDASHTDVTSLKILSRDDTIDLAPSVIAPMCSPHDHQDGPRSAVSVAEVGVQTSQSLFPSQRSEAVQTSQSLFIPASPSTPISPNNASPVPLAKDPSIQLSEAAAWDPISRSSDPDVLCELLSFPTPPQSDHEMPRGLPNEAPGNPYPQDDVSEAEAIPLWLPSTSPGRRPLTRKYGLSAATRARRSVAITQQEAVAPAARKRTLEAGIDQATTLSKRARRRAAPSAPSAPSNTLSSDQGSVQVHQNSLFKGFAFILTKVEQSSSLSSRAKATNNPDCAVAHISSLIESNGGRVISCFEEVFESSRSLSRSIAPTSSRRRTETAQVHTIALLSTEHQRTVKYLEALALQVPCLSIKFITDCISQQRLLEPRDYLLINGVSRELGAFKAGLGLTKWQDWYATRSAGLFHGLSMHVCASGPKFRHLEKLVLYSGAQLVSMPGSQREADRRVCDYVVSPKAPSHAFTTQVEQRFFRRDNHQETIPIISKEWLIECLINERIVPHHNHPAYHTW